MTTQHTPGPWEVWPEVEGGIGRDRHLVYISVGPKDRRRVAATGVYGRKRNAPKNGSNPVVPEDECRANARLIASAPELLRVARNMLAFAEIKWGNLDEGANESFADARRIISLARGTAE